MRCGLLPVTHYQLHQLREETMSRIDDLLNGIAEKLDHAADVITAELDKLGAAIKAGEPTEETLDRLHKAAERIHNIVDHELEPGGPDPDEELDETDVPGVDSEEEG